jgi:hypothetical protein
MQELRVTESQLERLNALQKELAAEHAGSYASVRRQDVIDYLLDLAEAVDDPERRGHPGSDVSSEPAGTETEDDGETADESGSSDHPSSAETVTTETESNITANTPDGILDLLKRHDDKWREGSGKERYEVELEDGTIETARTKGDVKAILLKNYG